MAIRTGKLKTWVSLGIILVFLGTSSAYSNEIQSNSSLALTPQKIASLCPEVIDLQPSAVQPKVLGFRFTGTNQSFRRLVDKQNVISQGVLPLVGCYVVPNWGDGPDSSYQVGVISRDLSGFYWKNAAGVFFRLTYDERMQRLTTDGTNPYFSVGNEFILTLPIVQSSCKVEDNTLGNIRTGFPRSPNAIKNKGIAENLVIVVDFPDAPFSESSDSVVNRVFQPKKVSEFYSDVSYGSLNMSFEILPYVVRIPNLSSNYSAVNGSYLVNGKWQDVKMVEDALSVIEDKVNLLKFESVNLLVSGGKALAGYNGGAHPGINIKIKSGTIRNTSIIGIGVTGDPVVPSWKVFAHELGHLFGLADLYVGDPNTGKSPGPFDLMGNTVGSANGLMGWSRWQHGWLDDDSVICDLENQNRASLKLESLSSRSGKRLYVKLISDSRALIIENRNNAMFDTLDENQGALAYILDFSIPTFKGPIQVIASREDRPSTWRDDVDKYKRATLTLDQTIEVEGRVYQVTSQAKDSIELSIYSLKEYEDKIKSAGQDKEKAERQAAAELKLKLEAEEKAAAELKIRKEAEVKVDAPLKKTTITCIKGKLTKKVAAVKPKCPSGYKLKK